MNDGDSNQSSTGPGSGTGSGLSSNPVCICSRHFEAALNRVRPSVALHDRQRYFP